MAMVTVYRFRVYHHATDEMLLSGRWGTRQAIAGIEGAKVMLDASALVDASVLLPDGFTKRGFDPKSAPSFQKTVPVEPRD